MGRIADKLIKAKVDSGFTPDADFTKLLTTAGLGGTTLLNDLDDASQVGYFYTTNFTNNTYASADMYTAVDDTNRVFMVTNANADRLAVADWSVDTNIVSTDSVTNTTNLDTVYQVAVDPSKEFAYTANSSSTALNRGVSRYDYSDPTNLTLKWVFQRSFAVYGLTVNPSRELLYFVSSSGLYTYDISPTGTNAMTEVDYLSVGSTTNYVHGTYLDIANDILYMVASNSDSLLAFDVSTATAAVLLDTYSGVGFGNVMDYPVSVNVDVAAGIAFVETRYGKLNSFDVSDPSNLTLLDTYTGVGYSNTTFKRSIAIDPGAKRVYCAYGTSFGAGVKVIEYSNPSNLTLETTIDHSSSAYKGAKVHLYN
jgi:hypothetical protein